MARRVRNSMERKCRFHVHPQEIATMKPSTKDQASDLNQGLKGKAKEINGSVTDNPGLDSRGAAGSIDGSLQRKVGEVEQGLGK